MKVTNLFKGLTALAILTSCVTSELEKLEAEEKEIIAGFLAANPGYEKTEGGIYFLEEVVGTGLSPEEGDYIFIHFTGWNIEKGITKENLDIRETSLESLKDDWDISGELEDYLYGPSKITYGDILQGIKEALGMMKEGGKASFVLPSDKTTFDHIPLLYEFELIKVVRDPIAYEDSVLNTFISRDFSEAEQVDDTTVWMKITESSVSEEYYTTGDTLFFNFTGRLVDGFGDSIVTTRIIDSNAAGSPVKIVFGKTGVPSGSMITTSLLKGLTMAFDSIQSGVKASVLMHYNFAFSDKGLLHPIHEYIIVPEYQTVVYDIEVVRIKPMAGK